MIQWYMWMSTASLLFMSLIWGNNNVLSVLIKVMLLVISLIGILLILEMNGIVAVYDN